MTRDDVRSLGLFSWAMSLFGFKQLTDLLRSGTGTSRGVVSDSANALDSLSHSVEAQLGEDYREVFGIGERLFRTVTEIFLGAVPAGRRASGGCQGCGETWPETGRDPAAGPFSDWGLEDGPESVHPPFAADGWPPASDEAEA